MAGDVGNPLHEYHHQRARPVLDAHFEKLHRRRIAGDRRVAIGGGVGREDEYVRRYTCREYDRAEALRKVLTIAVQMPFRPVGKQEGLPRPVRKDPELLDLALGMLFHYDP
ncbi:MAG: hypothetical protein OXF33_09245 [Rhodospirillales bacterium]|nr:hypothetical protein [Rhodospirillales bacterium]